MAAEAREIERRFSFIQGIRRQRKTVLLSAAVICSAVALLGLLPLGSPILPPWVVVPALGGYVPSLLVNLVLLRQLQSRVESGMELLAAEHAYKRMVLAGNLVFAAVFLVLLIATSALWR